MQRENCMLVTGSGEPRRGRACRGMAGSGLVGHGETMAAGSQRPPPFLLRSRIGAFDRAVAALLEETER
jgi:hypothetical protein